MQTSSDCLFSETAMLSAMGKARNAAIAITKGERRNVVIVSYSGA